MRNKTEMKEGYEKALVDLKEQLKKERSLTMSMPQFRGIIRIKPSTKEREAVESDPENRAHWNGVLHGVRKKEQ